MRRLMKSLDRIITSFQDCPEMEVMEWALATAHPLRRNLNASQIVMGTTYGLSPRVLRRTLFIQMEFQLGYLLKPRLIS
jgi:hypothetical protein